MVRSAFEVSSMPAEHPSGKVEALIFETGSTEEVAARRVVTVGALSVQIDAGALRAISLGTTELVRQIDFPVRDHNWATMPAENVREKLETGHDYFRYERRFEVGSGALECEVVYEGRADGTIIASGKARANVRFVTNRTGFTVLHPLKSVAGQPVRVTSCAGQRETLLMPDRIKPSQPVKDIAGLAFEIDGLSLDIAFSGEVFEMEDQRNWSDASFKTYCRPLVEPFDYEIAAGETQQQEVRITVSGTPVLQSNQTSGSVSIGAPLSENLPELLLAADADWLGNAASNELIAQAGLSSLLLRVTPNNAATLVSEAKAFLEVTNGALDLEIVLDDAEPLEQLRRVAETCDEYHLSPRHVMALPADYLSSYQPTGTWPSGLDPVGALKAARAVFPSARIGGGVLTNFTEFNRCRPDCTLSDFITHGNSATVHAADDVSVVQTLETLPHIFASARAICERPYRLGLTAIGMRMNPYGEVVSPNPDQRRLTMATWDPRARSLLGASWALGAIAASLGHNVEAMTLAAPVGPFGVVAARSSVARPWYEAHPEAVVYPIFHLLKALSAGGRRCATEGLPDKMPGVAVCREGAVRLVIANLTGCEQSFRLSARGRAAILDQGSFEAAAAHADWLETAFEPVVNPVVKLTPSALAFFDVEMPDDSQALR